MAEHSFDQFYRTQYPRLAGSLRLVANGDGLLAEEIAQEALARAFNHWSRLQSYDRPAGWVYRTAFNLMRKHWRDEQLLPLPETVVIEREPGDRIDLVRLLSLLSPQQREAVVLRYVLDHSSKEVAEMLNVSDGALRMTLHRSLAILRDRASVDLDADSAGQERL